MNKQPYATPPCWWEPRMSPFWVRWSRGYRRRQLRRLQSIEQIDVVGGDFVTSALRAGQGIMITPNHSAHYDSAALYLAADQLDTPLFFMTAWQVFGMSSRWERHMMQRLGCFSIDRENADRKAFKKGVDILRDEPFPLVIFPEGDIYHVTDRVTPFREGAAAIGIAAARKGTRPIVIIPCGMKFWYVDDPLPSLQQTMLQLESRLLLRPLPDDPLVPRIYRFAEALLVLQEIDYLGTSRSGPLPERIEFLSRAIVSDMEGRHAIGIGGDRPLPERVKELRQKIIQAEGVLESNDTTGPAVTKRKQLAADMDDLFVVMQLYSYPGDYLVGDPPIERVAETLDKFEEDVLEKEIPTVHGRRRVQVCFGEPISIRDLPEGRGGNREGVTSLTQQMQAHVQELIDRINRPLRLVHSGLT